jgi:hypothetical protein
MSSVAHSHQRHPPPPMDDNRSYVSARTGYTGNASRAEGSMAPQPLAQPQPAPVPPFYRICGCLECYSPQRESLEYDYTYDDVNGNKPPQSYPRIRERGEYYIDSYNGEPWSCSFGTTESVSVLIEYSFVQKMRTLYLIFSFFSTHFFYRMESGSIARIKLVPSCLPLCGSCCSIPLLLSPF